MIKKIGIAVLLGVSALTLVACGQQNNNGKDNASMSSKVQNASDAAVQKMKQAGSATADAMNKAGDKMKEAGRNLTGQDDNNAAAKEATPTTPPAPTPNQSDTTTNSQ